MKSLNLRLSDSDIIVFVVRSLFQSCIGEGGQPGLQLRMWRNHMNYLRKFQETQTFFERCLNRETRKILLNFGTGCLAKIGYRRIQCVGS